MPIYEYDCPVCGRFEHIQLGSQTELESCPRQRADCPLGKDTSSVKRVMSAAAFHLKGGGWYKTDYAPASGGSSSSSNSSNSEGSASGGTSDSSSSSDSSGKGSGSSTESSSSGDGGGKSAAGCGTGCACH